MSPAKPDAVNTASAAGRNIRRTVMERGTGSCPAYFFAVGLGLVARDFALVDLVDLLLVEEHLGVAAVHPAPQEAVEEIRVDVLAQVHPTEDLEGFGQGLAFLVRPVLRRERLEDVGDAHAARLYRHLLAGQALRIALAVHALVVPAGVLRHF